MRGCAVIGSMIVERAQKWVDEGNATGLQAGVARSKLEKQGQANRKTQEVFSSTIGAWGCGGVGTESRGKKQISKWRHTHI